MFFECVGFSYVVLDLVCSAILPSNWLARPCPNDAYVEELVSTKTVQDPLMFKRKCFHYILVFILSVLLVHPHHDHPDTTVLTHSTLLWHDIAL